MNLKILPYELTVCKVNSASCIDISAEFYFIAKTDEEISLVCKTEDAPEDTAAREDLVFFSRYRWYCFSLVGILSKLSGILAEKEIGIFAVSTYNTDYILVKAENLAAAADALKDEGYFII